VWVPGSNTRKGILFFQSNTLEFLFCARWSQLLTLVRDTQARS